jgi:hypothetical protein
VAVESVTREADAKGVEYCYVEVKDAGKSAVEVSRRQMKILFWHETCMSRLLDNALWVRCGAVAKGVEYCFVEVQDAGKSAVEVSRQQMI